MEDDFISMADGIREMFALNEWDPRPYPDVEQRAHIMFEHLRHGGFFPNDLKQREIEHIKRFFVTKMHMAVRMDREDRKKKEEER